MAGHEETGSDAKPTPGPDSVTPFGTPSPLHREKPIIEGQAIHPAEPDSENPAVAKPESSDADASKPEPLADVKLAMEELLAGDEELADREKAESAEAAVAEAAPAGTDVPPPHPEAPPHAAPPPRQGLSALTIIVVALIGAATGFASAYLARLVLDDSHKTFAAYDERLNGLTTKLAADENKIDTGGAANREALSALEKRLGAAEKSASEALGLATSAQPAEPKTIPSDADPNMPAPATVDLAPLQSRLDAIDQRVAQLEATLNAPKTAVRAPQEPEAKRDTQAANAPAIAIIAANLTQKVASGASFAAELAALEKLGADKAKLAPLQASASKGIVTTKELTDQFNALAPSLLASEKPQAEGGFFDKLKSHAASLVHIRKLGDLSGDDLQARVSRLQDALVHDDVDRALQEWAALPEAAKTASSAWAEAAKAHVGALAVAKAIAADAIANLAKAKS